MEKIETFPEKILFFIADIFPENIVFISLRSSPNTMFIILLKDIILFHYQQFFVRNIQ